MTETEDILQNISHRPWTLPVGYWSYYQEWNNALFLHWKVSRDELAELVPKNISIDTFKGNAWISLVAFSMEKIKPKRFPSVSKISDFHEINVRTYLTTENKAGVYFLNIEAEKQLSVWIIKLLSGLPYEKANISRQQNKYDQKYTSINKRKGFQFDTSFIVGEKIEQKSELDKWLSERYCLYLNKGKKRYRYEIHHKEWNLYNVEITNLKIKYKIGAITLNDKPDLVHYSDGVKVLTWQREFLIDKSTSS